MNDKAIRLLDQYDVTVKSVSKGRGTLIIETTQTPLVMKEYRGKTQKLELLYKIQQRFCDSIRTDALVCTKEGAYSVTDEIDNTTYILTNRLDGRECSYKSDDDIAKACGTMARMHLRFMTPVGHEQDGVQSELPIYFFADKMKRHTTECKRVYNYLKERNGKNDFERALFKYYDYFMEKALDVTRRALAESGAEYEAYVRSNGMYCHGDYQYHNVIFAKSNAGNYTGILNMEHIALDAGVMDFYLFFRKVCQKHDWSVEVANTMMDAYQNRRALPPIELRCLKLMLEYPEKFWKIIDRYYNSRKSWMPQSNIEKLEKLINQEKNKEKLINMLF